MLKRALAMRDELWPGVSEDFFWDRTKASGFSTIPRTLAYIMNIINTLTKGQPAGMTYLTIWCRVNVPGAVELASEKTMAFEAGFTGSRAVDTWRKRMRHLKRLGFIDFKSAGDHDFEWVRLYNPHHVIRRLGSKVQERYRAAWRERAMEIGAKDLGVLPEKAMEENAEKTPRKKSSQKNRHRD